MNINIKYEHGTLTCLIELPLVGFVDSSVSLFSNGSSLLFAGNLTPASINLEPMMFSALHISELQHGRTKLRNKYYKVSAVLFLIQYYICISIFCFTYIAIFSKIVIIIQTVINVMLLSTIRSLIYDSSGNYFFFFFFKKSFDHFSYLSTKTRPLPVAANAKTNVSKIECSKKSVLRRRCNNAHRENSRHRTVVAYPQLCALYTRLACPSVVRTTLRPVLPPPLRALLSGRPRRWEGQSWCTCRRRPCVPSIAVVSIIFLHSSHVLPSVGFLYFVVVVSTLFYLFFFLPVF